MAGQVRSSISARLAGCVSACLERTTDSPTVRLSQTSTHRLHSGWQDIGRKTLQPVTNALVNHGSKGKRTIGIRGRRKISLGKILGLSLPS